jgi:uncharacterized protein
MRRNDREITDQAEIMEVLRKADVCRLALADNNAPYLVTMNYGLKAGKEIILYFHCAHEGKKIDILKRNNLVCFGADMEHELILSDTGTSCGCSMRYASIVGFGTVSFVTDESEKREALETIMEHYTPHGPYAFAEDLMSRTTILRLDVTEITGKRRA